MLGDKRSNSIFAAPPAAAPLRWCAGFNPPPPPGPRLR